MPRRQRLLEGGRGMANFLRAGGCAAAAALAAAAPGTRGPTFAALAGSVSGRRALRRAQEQPPQPPVSRAEASTPCLPRPLAEEAKPARVDWRRDLLAAVLVGGTGKLSVLGRRTRRSAAAAAARRAHGTCVRSPLQRFVGRGWRTVSRGDGGAVAALAAAEEENAATHALLHAAPRYPGPQEAVAGSFAVQLGEFLADGAYWPWEEARALVEDATRVLAGERTLERIVLPAGGHLNVVGDVHGQFFDLLGILDVNGRPSPENPYLFNGDFVDRGSFSLETMLLLLAWKVAFPTYFRLGRGNHEAHEMNVPYGFAGEVLTKYGEEAYAAFQKLFDLLPLAHVVGGSVLVVHGGLPRCKGVGLAEIDALDRVAASRRGQHKPPDLFTDLLWADPREEPGFGHSERGGNIVTFGPDVTECFLEANGLDLVIRSHEVKDKGFEWTHGGKCLTVFSAPLYADVCSNRGAVVRLTLPEEGGGSQLRTEVRPFDARPRPPFYVPAMVYSPCSREWRNFLSPAAQEGLMRFINQMQ